MAFTMTFTKSCLMSFVKKVFAIRVFVNQSEITASPHLLS